MPKKEWAQVVLSAAAVANAMSPSEGIGTTCRKSNWAHVKLLLQMQWAQVKSLAAAAANAMGP